MAPAASDDNDCDSNERLRILLELVSDDIWECDAHLRVTQVRGRSIGQRATLAELAGRNLEELVDPAAFPEDLAALVAAKDSRQAFRDLVVAFRLPGRERMWARVSGRPLFARDGSFIGYLGTSTDITEERQRLLAERRRQQLESLGQLAGGVAHEFNNLLVPITMLSKLALPLAGDDGNLRLYLETINENGWKAAQIVRSVLTYARQMTPTAGPMICGEVVAERIQLLRQALPPTVVIETDIDDRSSRVLGNAGELSLIIVNLFNNASDAVDEYGLIRCTVNRVPLTADDQAAYGLATAEAVRIVVSDNGRGIPPDLRERIFQPFFTTKPIGQGTGLGLSVVEGIVKDWGGHITLASTPGLGTSVTILLPVLTAVD
jgi:signal transduction histidine kinase